MIRIYGSMLCGDCVQCRLDLDNAGVSYEFLDFADNLQYLKDFLAIRDNDSQFVAVRQEGRVGIPCIVTDDGTVTLSWESLICSRG